VIRWDRQRKECRASASIAVGRACGRRICNQARGNSKKIPGSGANLQHRVVFSRQEAQARINLQASLQRLKGGGFVY
jgi:hypothetical protein